MSGKPKNFSEAIDDLEKEGHSRLKSEFHRLEEMLNKMRPHIEEVSSRVGEEAKKAKGKAEEKIQENPWAAIGIVGLIFFVLGFLFAWNRKD